MVSTNYLTHVSLGIFDIITFETNGSKNPPPHKYFKSTSKLEDGEPFHSLVLP
jgi:hypothetical protein